MQKNDKSSTSVKRRDQGTKANTATELVK